ncbi:MAG: response regulator [bacterium]
MNEKPLLLIIDDEIEILKTLKDSLTDEDFRVEILSEWQNVLEFTGKLIPDLILLDIFMPNCDGLELLTKIKQEYPQQRIIIISGFGNIQIAVKAIQKGALDFIEKPLNLDEVLSKINFLKNEYKADIQELKTEKNINKEKIRENLEFIGNSFLFNELINQTDKIANLNFPVIIYGQHATGKTLLAKYIHATSSLNQKTFKIIDCSINKKFITQLKEILKLGPATLFLKNIQDLDIENQKELINLLEKNTKIRILASSTESIFKLCNENKFNKLLYYKLNVTPIEIPSLNKRRYDIPLLIDHFLKQENKKQNKKIIFNNRSIRFLRNFNWTGNITQLKQLIQNIITNTEQDHKVITVDDLTYYLKEKDMEFIEEQSFDRFNSLNDAINLFEKKFLLYYLKKHHFDLNQVCDRLSLTPIQLKDKILKFNL